MKRLIIFLFLLMPIFILAEDNYLKNYQNQKAIDYKLESLFNAIRIFNNRYAMTFIKENTINNKREKELIGPDIINRSEEQKLKDRLININVANSKGYTPLIVAIEYNNDFILKELLSMGVNTNIVHPVLGKNILNTAVYYNNYNVSKILINFDKTLVNKSDNDGWTPIMNAVLKDNTDILKLLLNNGADPLKKDKQGDDALELALRYSKGEIIKIIKDHLKNGKKE